MGIINEQIWKNATKVYVGIICLSISVQDKKPAYVTIKISTEQILSVNLSVIVEY